ncbi:MAG TPA: DUF4384 domain-containing protein, partial [Planctomycetaceae bacterium]|nr:DUF4384 domain-containing protein [Planctomycetaceae bacterium]
MSGRSCPIRDQIEAYAQGTLDEKQAAEIDAHLETCHHCQAALEELDPASAEAVKILRSDAPEPVYVAEAECQSALNRARKLPWDLLGVFEPANGEDNEPEDAEQEPSVASGPEEPGGPWPQVRGPYVFIRRIGGNLGVVYKAYHRELRRFEALKKLSNELADSQSAAKRFDREIAAAGSLTHPNIVQAYGTPRIAGERFLAMEYVDGIDLEKLVRERGPLPIPEACELVRQAATALQAVCQHGLVHRDVKPANLMVTRTGQVKLLDLGLARVRMAASAAADGATTGANVVVGTADYLAPEQIEDSRSVDIRADIYSLGCTFYKLLAGRAPFQTPETPSGVDKMFAHLTKRVPSIRKLRPDVPKTLAAILQRMLAKHPADRYDTPEQVASHLEPFAQGSDLPLWLNAPRAEPTQAPAQPPPSTRWFWELLGAAALLLLLALFVGRSAISRIGLFAGPEPGPIAGDAHATETPSGGPTAGPEETAPPESTAPPSGPPTKSAPSDSAPSHPAVATAKSKPAHEPPPPPAKDQQDQDSDTGATSPFDLRIELSHPDGIYHGPPAGPDRKGELIHVTVTSERAGFLYLLACQADGTVVCLLPNAERPDNKIAAGRPLTLPDPE